MAGKRKSGNTVFALSGSIFVLFLVFLAALFYSRRLEKNPSAPSDITAPTVVTKNVTVSYGTKVVPEDFIEKVEEESSWTACFAAGTEEDSLGKVYGLTEVEIEVTDAAGNKTKAKAYLNVRNLMDRLDVHVRSSLPEADAFLIEKGSKISYVTDISSIDTEILGEYEIEFLLDGEKATSVLKIADLKYPIVMVKTLTTWLNKPLSAEDFIEEIKDDTETVVAFHKEPKWQEEGDQEGIITVTDASGNTTYTYVYVSVKRDTKAPTVTVTDIDVIAGGTVSYKKAISYYDDIDTASEMKVTIDRSGVDLNTVGTYEVIYSVSDCSGNTTTVTGKVNVLEEEPKWADEEKIHEKADAILADILTDGMTDRQKAKAIYKWLKNHIGYISHSEKGNYMRGAYEGLFGKQGDCFVFAASAKELLTRAGIPNIDIVKATTNPSHYWNLVYIDGGWYHFDATPRKDKSEFFLLTDKELEEYSSAHNNSHNFDRSLYPEIQ